MVNWDSYLEPPDYGEGEMDVTETVYCKEELCNEFEKEVEFSGTTSWVGSGYGSFVIYIDYKCPACGIESEHEFERDREDYYDVDRDIDRMRDEGY